MTSYITRKSIVLVDDEVDLVQLFSDALKSAGLDVIPFDNPIKALEYIGNYHSNISLVLTDWRMPEMNGVELTKKVTEIDNEIKSMLMSAYDLEKDQLKEINKDDYLKKPIHMAKLIDSIKRESFAKDCKDTCETEASAIDKQQETNLTR